MNAHPYRKALRTLDDLEEQIRSIESMDDAESERLVRHLRDIRLSLQRELYVSEHVDCWCWRHGHAISFATDNDGRRVR